MLPNHSLPISLSIARPGRLTRAYLTLAKARLSAMVVITTAVGYLMAPHPRGALDARKLLWTVLGTALAAAGASAFNQLLETRRDALMARTRTRPLPTKTISPTHAGYFGLFACFLGLAILGLGANGLTTSLGLLNVLLYVLVYTPLKTRTNLNTLVGAVVGALPPVMGWTAATGRIDPPALLLGTLLFVWQIPHFMALAWLYRADYRHAGFRMCSVTDPTGRTTSLHAVLYALTLLPLGLMFPVLGITGWTFAPASLALAAVMVALALRFARALATESAPHASAARRLFIYSIIYLPATLALLLLTAHPR